MIMLDTNKLYEVYYAIGSENKNIWNEQFFKGLIKEEATIFITTKLKHEGYLIARQLKDEVEILSLYVKKKYRRKGHAKNLLKELKSLAYKKELAKIFLEVSIENYKAISLYNNYGFKEISIRKNYYNYEGRKVDAKMLCLAL